MYEAEAAAATVARACALTASEEPPCCHRSGLCCAELSLRLDERPLSPTRRGGSCWPPPRREGDRAAALLPRLLGEEQLDAVVRLLRGPKAPPSRNDRCEPHELATLWPLALCGSELLPLDEGTELQPLASRVEALESVSEA